MSVKDVCDMLTTKGLSGDVVDRFEEHGITGEVFICLNQDADYLKELAPRIADRVVLKKLMDNACCDKVSRRYRHGSTIHS